MPLEFGRGPGLRILGSFLTPYYISFNRRHRQPIKVLIYRVDGVECTEKASNPRNDIHEQIREMKARS